MVGWYGILCIALRGAWVSYAWHSEALNIRYPGFTLPNHVLLAIMTFEHDTHTSREGRSPSEL